MPIPPLMTSTLLLTTSIAPQQAADAGAASAPCEWIAERALDAVGTLHWDPAMRDRAAAAGGLPTEACADAGSVTAAFDHVLSTLDDPAIRLLDQSHFDRMLREWNGESRVGVGLTEVLSIDTDEATRRMTVIAPVPGSPAAAAGLRARDVVTRIGDADTDSLGLTGSAQRLRVDEGTSVRLTVLRNDEERDVVLEAERLPALEPLRLERRVAGGADVLIARLIQFTPGVAERLRATIDTIRAVDAVLLDLRDNPGGLLEELLAVGRVFLEDGSEMGTVVGPNPLTLRTEGTPSAPDIPLALAVGPGTASAAEVLAGALQRNGRARVYGTRTFGKGLVHQALPLEEGRWVLMLPAGQIELSDGRRILRNGIDPDVRTVNPVEQALRDMRR